MAIVADLSGNFPPSLPGGVDTRLSSVNRNNAGSPVGTLTGAYPGEIVLDTVNNITWMNTGPTNTQWTPVTIAI